MKTKWMIVPVEPTEEMLEAGHKAIPCICISAYTSRGLVAPDCPRCSLVDEENIYMAMLVPRLRHGSRLRNDCRQKRKGFWLLKQAAMFGLP